MEYLSTSAESLKPTVTNKLSRPVLWAIVLLFIESVLGILGAIILPVLVMAFSGKGFDQMWADDGMRPILILVLIIWLSIVTQVIYLILLLPGLKQKDQKSYRALGNLLTAWAVVSLTTVWVPVVNFMLLSKVKKEQS